MKWKDQSQRRDDILFSIIVPVYNTSKELLIRCINSILEQSIDDFECIVVDDGSEEACRRLLNQIEQKYDQINVIFMEHQVNSYARNQGVLASVGRYIMFVDSDDVIAPYVLEEAYEIIRGSNPDVVLGMVKAFSDEGIVFKRQNELELIYRYGRQDIGDVFEHIIGFRKEQLKYKDGYISGGPVARIVKAQIAKKTLFIEEELVTKDVLWNCEMLSKCSSAVIIPSLWYGYYHHMGTKSRKFYENGVELFYRQVDYYSRYIMSYWPDRKKGLYKLLWQEVTMYFRIYLNNTEIPWKIRYKLYKEIYSHEEFINMIENIDFKYEKNRIKRISREFIVIMLRSKFYLLTWFVFKRVAEKAL